MKRPDKKRSNRLKQSQNQATKQYRRMYCVVGISSMLLTGAIMAFLHFSSTESTMAHGEDNPEFMMMEEQVFINDMAIETPFVRPGKTAGENTIFMKKMLAESPSH
jgi:hypothetical protein